MLIPCSSTSAPLLHHFFSHNYNRFMSIKSFSNSADIQNWNLLVIYDSVNILYHFGQCTQYYCIQLCILTSVATVTRFECTERFQKLSHKEQSFKVKESFQSLITSSCYLQYQKAFILAYKPVFPSSATLEYHFIQIPFQSRQKWQQL